jgi:hypothetical protein
MGNCAIELLPTIAPAVDGHVVLFDMDSSRSERLEDNEAGRTLAIESALSNVVEDVRWQVEGHPTHFGTGCRLNGHDLRCDRRRCPLPFSRAR